MYNPYNFSMLLTLIMVDLGGRLMKVSRQKLIDPAYIRVKAFAETGTKERKRANT
jgi:hypothetical protein